MNFTKKIWYFIFVLLIIGKIKSPKTQPLGHKIMSSLSNDDFPIEDENPFDIVELQTAEQRTQNHQKLTLISQPYYPTDIETNEKRCIKIQSFYQILRKQSYVSSYRISSYLSYFFKQTPEFGWVETNDLNREFLIFLNEFSLTETDKNTNPEFSSIFGHLLGNMFTSKPMCSRVTRISSFIYRMLENKLIPKPLDFLSAFIAPLDKKFKLAFLLFNIQIFLETDDEMIDYIKVNFYKDDVNALIDDFLKIYELSIDASDEAKKSEFDAIWKKTASFALAKGSLYITMFSVYWASCFIAFSDRARWAIDNGILLRLNHYLTIKFDQFGFPKESQYVEKMIMKMKNDLARNELAYENQNTEQVQTRDRLHLGSNFVSQDYIAERCAECHLRKQMEIEEYLHKEGHKKSYWKIVIQLFCCIFLCKVANKKFNRATLVVFPHIFLFSLQS